MILWDVLDALREEGWLISPEAKPIWFCLVGLDLCASLLVVAEGGGWSCRGGKREGLLSMVGNGDGGFCTGVDGGG